ncbi:hypothetical protein [Amphiplicatus metriothermophilus]|uniref:Uncharacterized protein n=1 Tax=Amphiplicatus metriothermophilus TaxID=1519374 RepID=A0A239PJQ2_9PROT|nr:hypothetical protein [Amphiplicatus metriothermophilus]MBB5517861.1 hypothetical protein [Amphiplicatus metriothermophilus]SNT67805.1 hypothetical protein SAMN06297382_0298 [Amphiplicatus metriothermophilus]
MGLSFFIIATCLAFGAVAAIGAERPDLMRSLLPGLGESLRAAQFKRFSPRKTLFLFGPSANHPACRLQRRLLKPAIAAFIREDVAVIEAYGQDMPRRNGQPIDWLDPALLRHAMDAEAGFALIYVDEAGKTALRSDAPMVTADILARAGLAIERSHHAGYAGAARRRSPILKRLRAA